MNSNLTDKQVNVILALEARYPGQLSTNELRELLDRVGMNDDMFRELARPMTNSQIITVARQLVRKGLVEEKGYLNTARYWALTKAGRGRADSIRGQI